MTVFENCTVVVDVKNVPYKEKKKLKLALLDNGGNISYVITRECSFVVTSSVNDLSSNRQRSIQKLQIPVVGIQYVWSCLDEGHLLPLTEHNLDPQPAYPTSEFISHPGVKAHADILRLVATLLVLQLIRVKKLAVGQLLESLFRLKESQEPSDGELGRLTNGWQSRAEKTLDNSHEDGGHRRRLGNTLETVSQGTVESSSPSTVGNLEKDVVLDCRFLSSSGNEKFSDVSVTWLKDALSGVVYEYKNKAAQLQGQNTQFKNRAQLFSAAISTGNASLLLRNVKMEDEGVYRCNVNAPKVSGTTSINLRVAAFTAPTFTQRAGGSLFAEAHKWFPKPEVSWLSPSGQLLNSSTNFIDNSAGITGVASVLEDPVKENDTYTCIIQNSLVKAISEASVTENRVTERTYFILSAASTKVSSLHLLFTVILILSVIQTRLFSG
ncbi:V-set domain-containing T-cell activation inhibitor 1 [Anabarilius grahami]|uniref:V-set domain-containing T-cell activation inhibitor 1 n=1 Tax=Anabarilius grahami TaxID=495550 RepID=A0A3N0YX96_ANAGA|nr:V-set domain-containing T-cell activation inhibitor 1 [Anabarilius grahami]